MAHFKYLGEIARPGVVKNYGPTKKIKIPNSVGQVVEYTPIAPASDFQAGEDIGYDISDPRSLSYLRADKRFQEI